VGLWYAPRDDVEDTWNISDGSHERQGSYGIDTFKFADESESPVYYNYYCKTLHWEFPSSNIPDA